MDFDLSFLGLTGSIDEEVAQAMFSSKGDITRLPSNEQKSVGLPCGATVYPRAQKILKTEWDKEMRRRGINAFSHLNEKALKKLKADAEKNGMNRSEYARYLIRSMPVIPFPKYDLSGFIREANEIGQIVNNCAVKLRTTRIADVDDIIDCSDRLHRLADRFFPLYEARSDEIWKDKRTCNLSNGGRKYEMEIRMTKQEKEDFDRQVQSTFLRIKTAGFAKSAKNSFISSTVFVPCYCISIPSVWRRSGNTGEEDFCDFSKPRTV